MRLILDQCQVTPMRRDDGTVVIGLAVLGQIPMQGAPPVVVQTIEIPFDPLSAHKFLRDFEAVVRRNPDPGDAAKPQPPGNRAVRRRAERSERKNGAVILGRG